MQAFMTFLGHSDMLTYLALMARDSWNCGEF